MVPPRGGKSAHATPGVVVVDFPSPDRDSMRMAPRDSQRPRRPRSEQRQRQVMLTARVNPDEERQIRQAAAAQGISVARLIRSAVLAVTEPSPG